tara:strand:+ start:145 stop:807 length:663 start_codon:yes stop_codon:yes gene_type:complete
MKNNTNILIYTFLLVNSFFCLLLYAAFLLGWIQQVFSSDSSYLSYVICMIFFIIWILSIFAALWINKEISYLNSNNGNGMANDYINLVKNKFAAGKSINYDHSLLANTFQVKLYLKIKYISYAANLLILLGLIGTVIGFIIAVGGLGDSLAGGQNLSRVQTVLGQIVNGMGVALFTTLLGSIFGGIWLQLHYEILSNFIEKFVINVIEKVESEIIPNIDK